MEIEKEINQIKNKLDNYEKRISALERLSAIKSGGTKKKISVKEFILAKKPKNDNQKTLAIGYYLENCENLSSLNRKDLEEGFRSAKEGVPANINDRVNQNIKKGYMMKTKEKKNNLQAWTLTNSGTRYVENDFKE